MLTSNMHRERRLIVPAPLNRLFAALAIALLVPASFARAQGVAGADELLGPQAETTFTVAQVPERFGAARGEDTLARLRYWNQVAINASALDHTPVAAGESRVFGEQVGPVRTARAFAIAHVAIFDAVNAVVGGYKSYTGLPRAPRASVDAAIAQAAHDTLSALYPSQKANFDTRLKKDLAEIGDNVRKQDGIALGKRAAAAILTLRAQDGSAQLEPCVVMPCPTGGDFYPTSSLPGRWRQDPISLSPLALGAFWDSVATFVIASPAQFRLQPPPALSSAAYTAAFDEIKRLGGDGVVTPTQRSPDQTVAGTYWAYDGTPGLGTPPRLYNQIAVQIAAQRGTNAVGLARLLALMNVAMADAASAIWETKYQFELWRPITGIREGDERGPTGQGDGNPSTVGDPSFMPLGAPASNISAPNFTPPFPAYPSGHAGFGGAVFQTLRRFYGTDNIAFSFVSDEFNGVTKDNQGNTRPRLSRTFATLTQAEQENGQSRIYLGIHWSFDSSGGIDQGRRIADYVFANAFTPQR